LENLQIGAYKRGNSISLLKETKKEGLRSPTDVKKDLMGGKYTPFWDIDF